MLARFLLGPAGSGKTFRCLAEIRAALRKDSARELIFLAPKQATYQIERQLLADDSLQGFTRLRILSFERLAQFVFEKLNAAAPKTLSNDGRVMVLRALLSRHANDLKLFRQSARRPGFAQQLNQLLRELQQHQIAPEKLRAIAGNENLRAELRDKLNDLALLQENYSRWLDENKLRDADRILDSATETLQKEFKIRNPGFQIEGLWLDGFAEMTPQELDLLAAILPFCETATLAFCLDAEDAKESSWLSMWNCVGKTFQQCRQRMENLADTKIEIEFLRRGRAQGRFGKNPPLQFLEQNWQKHCSLEKPAAETEVSAISISSCANPGAEAVSAAREILKFIRRGNRFRDCAVIVRNLENYHKPLARIFQRYQIPFFLDRRESVAHHPLAELTRGALRTAAFDWRHEDFFSALKAGFCDVAENEIDALENAALEFGWHGQKWREPLPDEKFERLRQKVLPPFEKLYQRLSKTKFPPDGRRLAEVLREFWKEMGVETILEKWSESQSATGDRRPAIHATVWQQMESLLDNLELGFANEQLPLRDWLPVLESGLGNLTVGVIPPVLDEVLVGAIDRARNPDLKFALVLGVNETVFPASPVAPVILTNADRDELRLPLDADLRDQISREQFYGYLACTRAAEKLTLTFSRNDANGNVLNPSPFIARLRGMFPRLKIEEFPDVIQFAEIENAAEIAPLFFSTQDPKLEIENLENLCEPDPGENLSPPVAERLYGNVLRTSISRLEEFAQCPFRFFVKTGLRADERKVFELDARERGSFQHEVLKEFHIRATKDHGRWRDLTPQTARQLVKEIADELMEQFRAGLLRETAQSRFAARVLTESLQEFVAVSVAWLREQNGFDPAKAELDFGGKESPETAWEIDLGDGRQLSLNGRIDRVDLCGDEKSAAAIVIDYKSSQKKLDRLLVAHGIQLQLLAYLNVLRHWKNPRATFGVEKLDPAGAFYVNLRGQFKNGTRDDVLGGAEESRRVAYKHNGRFDAGVLEKLDSGCARDQFNYRVKNNGEIYANSAEALPRAEFERLLDGVEIRLREFGRAIFSGVANVDPYRKGSEKACDKCDYAPVCRIDPWTHSFRVLRAEDQAG
ncbi:MAG TPA: PD-(D/E)XK nuclease family protein [Verrucomicrobiae bacterium]|nr:PD-(D/E)XK nuclease family protein [Verrucomicrobiae bacterium]